MANHNTGPKNGLWKGGRSIASNGYVLIRVGNNHPLADSRGYAYEHRLVASKKLGRWLLPSEQVHHINEDKQDNRPENLEVVTSSAQHRFFHRTKETGKRKPDEPNPVIECACGCGNTFYRFDSSNRPRTIISGHNRSESPTQDFILETLAAGPRLRSELINQSNRTTQAIAVALSKLKARGVVQQVSHGVWSLKEVNHG